MYTPLEVAARNGYPEVGRGLMKHFGVKGCGASGGVVALALAAQGKHVHIMAILVQAGVAETDEALIYVAAVGGEVPVKFCPQQQQP